MSSGDAQVASSALRVPALQFDQHRPQQGVIRLAEVRHWIVAEGIFEVGAEWI
jgi:hypothetical protein